MRFAMKTLTYATMHLTVAVAVAWVLTRDWRVALAVGLVEPLVQTAALTLHERAWAKADRRRGRLSQPDRSHSPGVTARLVRATQAW